MTHRIARDFPFEAGHRVLGHEGQCKHLHGHSYTARIRAEAAELDDLGRVIDFGILKERVGNWIDEYWDHALILFRDDPLRKALPAEECTRVFRLPSNPTAENLAQYLLECVCPEVLRGTGVRVYKVTIKETAKCRATAKL